MIWSFVKPATSTAPQRHPDAQLPQPLHSAPVTSAYRTVLPRISFSTTLTAP